MFFVRSVASTERSIEIYCSASVNPIPLTAWLALELTIVASSVTEPPASTGSSTNSFVRSTVGNVPSSLSQRAFDEYPYRTFG